jgi:Flp pilus assembly protein CpaB
MNKRQKRIRMVGIVALGVLICFLVMVFLARARQTVGVVVAARYLEAGTVLTADVLDVAQVHPSSLLPGAVEDPELLDGLIVQVQRVPGDQVTLDMAGETGGSVIAAGLLPEHRAVAVDVDRASGAAGTLRPGDRVDVVATIDLGGVGGRGAALTFVAVRDVRVLVVPQEFRYMEAPAGEDGSGGTIPGGIAGSPQAQQRNVVVLDVPLAEIEITGGYTDTISNEWVEPLLASPAELLPLLNEKATLHLVLRAPDARDVAVTPVDLVRLLDALSQVPSRQVLEAAALEEEGD